MKLNNIRIKNFCSFGNKGIDIKMNQTFNLIVGPNDTGKSNLFRAFTFASEILSENTNYSNNELKQYFHGGDINNPIELGLEISFDPMELDILSKFCIGVFYSPKLKSNEFKSAKRLLERYYLEIVKELFTKATIEIIINDPTIIEYEHS